jgi:hypothetical protein
MWSPFEGIQVWLLHQEECASTVDEVSKAGGNAGEVDIALIVVHGIGQQVQSETLQAWAGPILRSIHTQSHERDGGEVIIVKSNLTDGPAQILAEVVVGDKPTRRLLITEARWSDSFLAQSHMYVVLWALSFTRSAYVRVCRHVFRMTNNPLLARKEEKRDEEYRKVAEQDFWVDPIVAFMLWLGKPLVAAFRPLACNSVGRSTLFLATGSDRFGRYWNRFDACNFRFGDCLEAPNHRPKVAPGTRCVVDHGRRCVSLGFGSDPCERDAGRG